MTVDFHSHTVESDGTLAPAEVAAMMVKRGVTIFSITDHDTLRAYGQFEGGGATVIPGIEINTTWNGSDVHILGYGLPLEDDSPLAVVLEANRTARRARIDRMVAGLNRAGYPITVDEVLAESSGGHALGRPHVAKALIRHGYVSDVNAAFRDLLSAGKPGYAPSHHITPVQAIEIIVQSHGVPVLAHPGRLKDDSIVDRLVDERACRPRSVLSDA